VHMYASAMYVIYAHSFLPRSITPAVCWHRESHRCQGGNRCMTVLCLMIRIAKSTLCLCWSLQPM
jgi:hypothetical protein